MNKNYKAYEDKKLLNKIRVYLEDITQDNVKLVPRKCGYGDHQAEAIIKIMKQEVARVNVGFENETYVIEVWGNKEQLTERSFFKALFGELGGKTAESKTIRLDNCISDHFGYLDIKASVRFSKISEEYEEVAERYLDGNVEEMFLELLDLIQAAKSYLIFITRKLLKPKKVIKLLAVWKEKQENRKIKYSKKEVK